MSFSAMYMYMLTNIKINIEINSINNSCSNIYLFYVFLSDGTLTTSNVCQALASVKDWHSLGYYTGGLGVPGAVCNDIRDNRPNKTEEEKKTEMLVYYLHTMPQASWQTIAGALYYMKEEVTALEAVKRFLHHTPGQLTHDTQLSIISSYTCAHTCQLSIINI